MRRLRPRCATCKNSPAPFRCNLDDAFFCGPCFEKHGSAHPQGRAQDAFEHVLLVRRVREVEREQLLLLKDLDDLLRLTRDLSRQCVELMRVTREAQERPR